MKRTVTSTLAPSLLLLLPSACAWSADAGSVSTGGGSNASERSAVGQSRQSILLAFDTYLSYSWSQGQAQVKMQRVSDYFCYLTGVAGAYRGSGTFVAGEFRGAAEWAQIKQATDTAGVRRWMLHTGSGLGALNAAARCFLFDQNQTS